MEQSGDRLGPTVDLWSILRDIVMLLTACLICGGLVSRAGHSPLVGYLIAGMVLGGPGSLGLIESPHEIEAISELGVAMLLFSLGLEFSLDRLRKLGPRPLWGGVFQVVCTLVLGAVVIWPWTGSIPAAIAFGAMISLSSTAVVLRMLMERSEIDLPHGRNCLAVLLAQDIAVVPLALLVAILGGKGGLVDVVSQAGRLLGMASILVVALLLLNRIAIHSLGTLTLHRNRELTVIFAVATGLGSAWAAHAVGVSPALGAFVAGMLLGSSRFATQIRADISTLRVLLLTLFFGSAGMVADPLWILSNAWVVLVATAALIVGKMLIIWILFRWLGQSTRVAAATGLCLAQVGEFAFVLGALGQENGVVNSELFAMVISTTIATFIASAFLVPAAVGFGNRMATLFGPGSDQTENAVHLDAPPDIILVGFGPAGQAAARPLIDRGLNVSVLDLNVHGVRHANRLGFHGHVGDATQLEVLEHAQVPSARAVIITIPHHQSALTILDNVRQLAPAAHVLVRSRYKLHTDDFSARGVIVIGDEEEVGLRLAESLEGWLADQPSPKLEGRPDGEPA